MRATSGALTLILVGLFGSVAPARGQSGADTAAIKQTALHYLEGWYECNPERMERALNPDLAKRIVSNNPQTGKDRLDELSALKLVQITRGEAAGRRPPKKTNKRKSPSSTFTRTWLV